MTWVDEKRTDKKKKEKKGGRGDNKTDFDRSLKFMACHKFILKITLKFYCHFLFSLFLYRILQCVIKEAVESCVLNLFKVW